MKNFVRTLKSFVKPLMSKKVFSVLFYFYRCFFSLHFGGACRFTPSCSFYAEKAFLSHPFFLACRLVICRLIRCHSFSSSFGEDPVPSPGSSGSIKE